MFNSKRGKILTVVIVIFIIIILGVVGYFAYDILKGNTDNNETASKGEEKKPPVISGPSNTVTNEENTNIPNYEFNIQTNNQINNENPKKEFIEGYEKIGTIRIPAIDLEYPILAEVTKKTIETAVALLYTTGGINQVGNTVIVGHNYRNSQFFSRNDELKVNDKIYIKDQTGQEVEYIIYDIFETVASDASFYQRDTKGKREITLSTCTDNASTTDGRLIILAVEK